MKKLIIDFNFSTILKFFYFSLKDVEEVNSKYHIQIPEPKY